MKLCLTFIACSTLLVLSCCAGTVPAAIPEARIVGGDDAVLGQLPYQAALSVGGSYNCGAVIIGEYYALTALTCVCSAGSANPWPPQLFMVSAGTVDLYTGGQRIRVEQITINPDYNELDTGIALLRLTERFDFNANVGAIALAQQNPPEGALIDISGWGRLKEADENMHRTLQVNMAQLLNERECRMLTDDKDVALPYNDQVLCLGHTRKNGICRGDFGGPAVYQNQLVGLAADVLGECGSLLPDRFISIAANYEWLAQHLQ